MNDKDKTIQQLRDELKDLQIRLELSPDGIVVVNEEGRYLDANPAFCSLVKYSKEELLNMYVKEISVDANLRHFNNLLKDGISYGEIGLLRKDGSIVFVETHAVALQDGRYIGFHRDISRRRQAEEALRKSEEQHNLILNGITDLVVLYQVENGSEFRFLKANNSTLKTIRMTEEQITGQIIDDVLPREIAETFKNNYSKAIKAKHPIAYEETVPYGVFETRLIPLFDLSGRCTNLIGIHRDITEKKALETHINRLERLGLVGEMAAGIGHEVRNPMTAVRGFLQLLANKEKYAEEREYFDLMIDELDRANSIIKEYLSLAKDKMLNLQLQNINLIINKIIPLLQADALMSDKSIKLELDLQQIPDLLVDEKEISQLVINLFRNGLEATKKGSAVIVKTCTAGEDVILSVSDHGPGIPSEILDKLGTPFVSTKENGTGLGLAICYSIATRHNAVITVDTNSTGTTFFVKFQTKPKVMEQFQKPCPD